MNSRTFNSINDLMEYKKNLELSSEFIFIQYLNVIYSNLLLREEVLYQSNSIHRKNTHELKMNRNISSSVRRNSTKRIPQKLKLIDKGICLKTFLEYIDLQEFIGERIFKYLNKSKKIKLNKDDFTNGLNNIYYGDIKNLIQLTFFLCDFNDDGKIYKSDMKLLLAYIPSSSEYFQKSKIKQINKIINTFFEEKIGNPEEGNEKEINFDDYSKYILEYNENNNINNTELLNEFNYNAPFYYFISILTYLFTNCPFKVKSVDYFIYSKKKMKLILRNDQKSTTLKNALLTSTKKSEYSNINNQMDLNSNGLTNIKLGKNTYEKEIIPKIGQKNLFNKKRSTSQNNIINDKENGRYINIINFKKGDNNKNKDFIISKNKNEINLFKKTKDNNLLEDKLRKSFKNLASFRDLSLNKRKNELSPLSSHNKNEFSHSPKLYLKKNSSNEDSFSNSSNKNLFKIKYNNSKVKLPSIPKEKLSPMSVGFRSSKEEENDLKEPGELVLCEYSDEEVDLDNNKELNVNSNKDINEIYLYKLCEDINGEQKIMNKFYAVLSGKEILFFSSDLKNELCDLWFIYKTNISIGKQQFNNNIYFTIIITFFNNNFTNKLYFSNENDCICFANKIKESIHDLSFSDFYELQEKLGQGHFATVNKCKNKTTGQIYAAKIINKNELKLFDLELIQQEKNYLSLIKHPNIISLKDYFEDKKNIYLITECCNGGDLLSFIEKNHKNNIKISEKEVAKIIKKIAECIKYLNFFGIVHRDIKPENILFSEENEIKTIKIIDLGVCQTLTYGQMATEPIGTNGYISPEIYLHNEYSFKIDIWSLGVILYLMITEGILPFDNENMDFKVIGKKVLFLQQEYPEKYFGKKSQGLITLLDKMLEKNQNKRIDINSLVKDSWFNIIKS